MQTYTPDQIREQCAPLFDILREAYAIVEGHRSYYRDGTCMSDLYYNRTEQFGSWDYDTLNMSDAEVLRLRELRQSLEDTIPPGVLFRDIEKLVLDFSKTNLAVKCH